MSVRSLNKVMLIGNLTRDPNLRFTPNSTAVCSFGLATNRTWTPSDGGEKQERTEFHSVVAWGKLAEICGNLLHKGDKTFVEGRLQTREWKSEDGQNRKITEIVIDDMMLLHTKGGSSYSSDDSGTGDDSMGAPDEAQSAPRAAAPKESARPSDTSTDDVEDVSDDIPF